MYNPRFEKETFKKEVKQNVKHLFRKEIEEVSEQELYQAVSYAVKEAIIDNWIATQKQYEKDDPKIAKPEHKKEQEKNRNPRTVSAVRPGSYPTNRYDSGPARSCPAANIRIADTPTSRQLFFKSPCISW